MSHENPIIYLWLFVAMFAAMLAAAFAVTGQPPKHCHYFVPVTNHPGIYSCSEHPRPVGVPR